MKNSEIKIGKTYRCKVTGKLADVRITGVIHHDRLPPAELGQTGCHGVDGLVVDAWVLLVGLDVLDVPERDVHVLISCPMPALRAGFSSATNSNLRRDCSHGGLLRNFVGSTYLRHVRPCRD